MPPRPDSKSPTELFFGRKFRLDFELASPLVTGNLQYCSAMTQRRVHLKRGPFHVGDLILTQRLQTPKGHSPFAGPFKVVKVVGRYSYILSDGQKWNTEWLKIRSEFLSSFLDGMSVLHAFLVTENLLVGASSEGWMLVIVTTLDGSLALSHTGVSLKHVFRYTMTQLAPCSSYVWGLVAYLSKHTQRQSSRLVTNSYNKRATLSLS